MTGTLWTAALLLANLWASGGLDSPNNTEKGAIAGGANGTALGALAGAGTPGRPIDLQPVDGEPVAAEKVNEPRPEIARRRDDKTCCDQPPSTAEVLRALPKTANIPYIYDENRDVFEVKVEKVADKVDAPRFYPLIGRAELHHCRWKCTVHFNRVVESSHPFPFRVFNRCTEVVYVEKDMLQPAHLPNDKGTTETSEPPVYCPGGHHKTATGSPKLVSARPVAATLRQVYVIVDDGELGQRVTALPAAEQTVTDAVSKSVHADKVRKVRVTRVSADGKDGVVELPVDWNAITRDGHTASNYQLEPGDRVHVFVEPAKAVRTEAMSLDVVVRMSKAGVSQKIIMRQIEQTGANFNLSADDIIYLREQGVSNRVISVMQQRREVLNAPPNQTKYATTGYPEQAFNGYPEQAFEVILVPTRTPVLDGLRSSAVGAIVGACEISTTRRGQQFYIPTR